MTFLRLSIGSRYKQRRQGVSHTANGRSRCAATDNEEKRIDIRLAYGSMVAACEGEHRERSGSRDRNQ